MAWTQPDQVSRNVAAALAKAAIILIGGGDLGKELTAIEKNRIRAVAGSL
jgi:hypothetical protein